MGLFREYLCMPCSRLLINCKSTHTHQLLHERATERYEHCCDEVYPLADGHGRAGIFIFAIVISVEKSDFLREVAPHAIVWCHSTKRVLSEPLLCVGSGIVPSASHCYRKGNSRRPVLHKV